MTKTTIYLNVDGVINALSKNPPRSMTGWTGAWNTAIVSPGGHGSFNITWSSELLEALEAIALRSDVEIRWLTTWENHAAEVLSASIGWELGGSLAVVRKLTHKDQPMPDDDAPPEAWDAWQADYDKWWKHATLERNWDGESQIVWLDDDLRYSTDAVKWLDELPVRTLAISPNSNLGLTRKHLEQIQAFLDAVPESG